MDLWIRSQDKMNLVQIKQISLNYQDNKQVIANYAPEQYENSGCYFELLGTYKTKERAIKVLDEIQTILRGKYATSFDYKTSLKGFKPEDIEHMLELMAVYEMPEK